MPYLANEVAVDAHPPGRDHYNGISLVPLTAARFAPRPLDLKIGTQVNAEPCTRSQRILRTRGCKPVTSGDQRRSARIVLFSSRVC